MSNEDGRRRDRYDTIGEVKFSHNRSIVVSVLGGRVVLGHRIYFEDDAGEAGQAFLKNSQSLSADDAKALVGLLGTAYDRLIARLGGGE